MKPQVLNELRETWRKALLVENPHAGREAIQQIFYPLHNKAQNPLKILLKGTNFQIKVWEALLRIPEGAAVSYSALAKAGRTSRRPAGSRHCGRAKSRRLSDSLPPGPESQWRHRWLSLGNNPQTGDSGAGSSVPSSNPRRRGGERFRIYRVMRNCYGRFNRLKCPN